MGILQTYKRAGRKQGTLYSHKKGTVFIHLFSNMNQAGIESVPKDKATPFLPDPWGSGDEVLPRLVTVRTLKSAGYVFRPASTLCQMRDLSRVASV